MISKDKEKKLKSWIKNLNKDQTWFISSLIKNETEKATVKILSVIDMCIFAAIAEGLPELTTQEIQAITEMFAQEITANKKYIIASEEEMKMIKNQEIEAEKLTIQLLEEGQDQKYIIDKLKREFKQLTSSDIKNIYKRTKDKWVLPKIPATEKVKDNLLPGGSTKKLKEEDKKLLNMEEEIKGENSNNQIEILDPIRVKYNNQVVVIGPDYIECVEGKFDTIEDLERYKEEEIKRFNDRIESIKHVVNKFSF